MKNRRMIRILWIALGIHVLFFLIAIGIFILRDQLMPYFARLSYEGNTSIIFLSLFLEPIVYISAHAIMTLILVKQPEGEGVSISREVIGAVGFGFILPLFSRIGAVVCMNDIARLGSESLAYYSIISNVISYAAPIRIGAVSLMLIASGMSIDGKLRKGQTDRSFTGYE